MYIIDNQNLWLIVLLMFERTIGQSLNQPKFCASVTWNPDAITFADSTTIGEQPNTVFINVNNSIYVSEGNLSQVQIWLEGSTTPLETIANDLINPYGLFVSNGGDIYIDNGATNGQVEKWTLSASSGVMVMNVNDSCYGLFIDTSNSLYCSMGNLHQVVKLLLNNTGNLPTMIAGTGVAGSASNMLNDSHGIFVDVNFNLYVADSGNNRIQIFKSGQSNGITMAGDGAAETVILNYPTAIVLDGDGYLYIADTNNDRIVRSDPSGFRCLVGCLGTSGSASNQLNKPSTLSFDNYGNLFVADQDNNRIQKFLLATNSCGPSYNQPKFCPTATWNPAAITFADSTTVGLNPYSVFVSINNTIYVADTNLSQVQIWLQGSSSPTATISSGLNSPYAVFASIVGDMYVDNGASNGQLNKWAYNAISSTIEMYSNGICFGLFIDILDNLYCSMVSKHQVIKKAINNDANTSMVIAGGGVSGSTSTLLNEPRGIFVDTKFNLYVADCQNNRIQLFKSGQLTGTTTVGSAATGTITLNCPSGLILDYNGYLFITDYNNHRVIGSGPNGYRCLVGCSEINGASSDQLYNPTSLSFDQYGNLFIADMSNNRIQKFLLATNSCGPSYNQPKFCASATWNLDAITFADSTTAGINPYSVFINTNNTIYIADRSDNSVQIWPKGSTSPTSSLSTGLDNPFSVFVTLTGDIYVDNGYSNGRIDKWLSNAATSSIAVYVNGSCYGLFVDIYDNVYCSLRSLHIVIKKSSNDDANTSKIIAGNGNNDSASDTLNEPGGIFVTTKFNLYVADSGNHRIQLFVSGQLNATTVVGATVSGTITLNYPTGIILDSQGYLFIADTGNNRIIGSSANGFRCIVGCLNGGGTGSDQLSFPWSLGFDSSGNLFVADSLNNRVQKFLLNENTCGRSYNQPKFCTYAAWNPNATTLFDNSTIGTHPNDIYINTNNTIYVAETSLNQVQVWLQGNTIPTRTISAGLNSPHTVVASILDDIYIGNGVVNGEVDKWALNATSSVVGMYSNEICYDIFLDIYDNLFCSLNNAHQVIKKSFNDNANITSIVAGTGSSGSGIYMLNGPRGIFIDMKFNLYVADCGNSRIQLFQSGQLNGTTVIENGMGGTFILSCPTAVLIDAAGYIFIADYDNHRIVANGPDGYRCIVGCSGNGSADNELYNPQSLSFDMSGNLFVLDAGNSRIQKFLLATNSCYETTTAQNIPTTTMDIETSMNSIQSTLIIVTTAITIQSSAASFVAPSCAISTYIGSSCNISNIPCTMLKPCQNGGTCTNDNTTLVGYVCSCLTGFGGTECQYDYRLCQTNTCWNNGTCNETSNTTFNCICASGWQDTYCQTKINYCGNITCLNNGVCEPLLLNYKCLCLGDSYSGRYCEITSSKTLTLQMVSKSFAFIAIIAIVCVAIFIVVMDILTYFFGMDLTSKEREKLRQKKYMKQKKPAFFQRYIRIDVPSLQISQRSVAIIEATI